LIWRSRDETTRSRNRTVPRIHTEWNRRMLAEPLRRQGQQSSGMMVWGRLLLHHGLDPFLVLPIIVSYVLNNTCMNKYNLWLQLLLPIAGDSLLQHPHPPTLHTIVCLIRCADGSVSLEKIVWVYDNNYMVYLYGMYLRLLEGESQEVGCFSHYYFQSSGFWIPKHVLWWETKVYKLALYMCMDSKLWARMRWLVVAKIKMM
jgi:hypothetical protein